MADLKIRLNQIVSSNEVNDKKQGPLHYVSNSFKRNTILERSAPKSSSLPYQCKIPAFRHSRRDISYMLQYILQKKQMEQPDRNLIRRILVGIFDQQLIHSGSKDFINYIDMLEGQEGDSLQPDQQFFYLILRGAAIVKTSGIEYFRGEGETFGELEIMAGTSIQEIFFEKNTLLITIREQHFKKYFLSRFKKIYSEREAELISLFTLLQSVPPFSKYLFLSKYKTKTFQLGEKIAEKNEPLTFVYIVGDKLKEERLKYLSKGCLGLTELQRDKTVYLQTAFCPEQEMSLPFFKKEDVQIYLLNNLNNSVLLQNSAFFQKSLINTTASVLINPEVKISTFMRVRRVKLGSEKISKTQSTFPIENEFKFLKTNHCSFMQTSKKIPMEVNGEGGRKKNYSICLKKASKNRLFK